MRTLLGPALACSVLLCSCAAVPRETVTSSAPAAAPSRDGKLIVFAAASLTEAFGEIGADFEAANAGTEVMFNFAGSPMLRTQIEEGAPADVFASANMDQMDLLVARGMVAKDAARIFLANELVLILPPTNPAEIVHLQDLAKPGIKLVLAAPDVPAGAYARQALDKMSTALGVDFKDLVLANVVSEEDNVKQVVTKVQLSEADAGIVYASDARAAPDVASVPIPTRFNVVAQYPIAVLVHSANADMGARFTDYVLSAEAQAVLKKWGFRPAD